MLTTFRADMHVHTCLSPCGDLLMSPKKIIARALEQRIDIVAITDHNSAENVSAALNAAAGSPLVVVPGMEVCTSEEIHVLALFENLSPALELQHLVYDHLPGENDPEVFGEQIIANERDQVEGYERKLLIGATDLSLKSVVDEIHRLEGAAIASHIDRESYSVLGQLGFIPRDVRFEALELSVNITNDDARKNFSTYAGYTFIRNSDAHVLSDIGKQTTALLLEKPSFGEIRMAFGAEEGRNANI